MSIGLIMGCPLCGWLSDSLMELIFDCTGRNIDRQERDEILLKVAELLPGRKHVQDRMDRLNEKKVPVNIKPSIYEGQWDREKFTDNLRLARNSWGLNNSYKGVYEAAIQLIMGKSAFADTLGQVFFPTMPSSTNLRPL